MTKPTNGKNPKQDIPLNVEDETHQFVVTLAMSQTRLREILSEESISMNLMGVRHITDDDLELLKMKEDEDDVKERIEKMEYRGEYDVGDRS